MTTKAGLIAFAKFVFLMVGSYWLALGIHEWYHLVTLNLTGGTGHIILTWYGASTIFTVDPQHMTLVALAGGLLTAATFAVIFIFDWLTNDVPEACAVLPVITSQIAYGIYEGIFVYSSSLSDYLNTAGIVVMIGFAVGVVPALWIATKYGVLEWLKPEEKK